MVQTYKQQFNKKYGFSRDESHSIPEIARLTGYRVGGLRKIVEKGKGAFFSNPSSVRPIVKSPEQWGVARLYSAVMGGKAARVDASHLVK
jgi:hypothetical protein